MLSPKTKINGIKEISNLNPFFPFFFQCPFESDFHKDYKAYRK